MQMFKIILNGGEKRKEIFEERMWYGMKEKKFKK